MATVSSPLQRTLLWLRCVFQTILLVIGTGWLTFGVLYWQHIDFTFHGLWFEDGFELHPLHAVVMGLVLVPTAIWDLIYLETVLRAERMASEQPADE